MKQNQLCEHMYLYMTKCCYAKHWSFVENWTNRSPLYISCEFIDQRHQHGLMLAEMLDKFSPSLDSKAWTYDSREILSRVAN